MATLSGGSSQYPADRLIRDIIRTRRSASVAEVEAIIDRVGSASFNRRPVPVDAPDVGRTFLGCTFGGTEDSLVYHLYKRVVLQREWGAGTTPDQYTSDLHAAVRHPLS